jgi:RNA polymerase sigma factor (sigma-70 family)
MRGRPDPDDVRELVRGCADGDGAARRTFQDRWGEDVYNFPVKIYGVSAERAADFYVYVFEGDRIFTRMRTFEGRNGIQFRTFLAYYVLRSLFLEWQRGSRELDTESLGDEEPGPAIAEPAPVADADVAAAWQSLGPEERLDLKLLSLLEHPLGADDVRLLARLSRRSLDETVALVAEIEAGLRARDVELARLRDQLDSVWGWIVLRRGELQEIGEKIRLIGSNRGTTTARRLEERRGELEAALEKRMRQRERLLDEIRTFKMTTPYKDIARLLNSAVGTVCSRIFRLRQRLEREWRPEGVAP